MVSEKCYTNIFKRLYQLIPAGINFFPVTTFWEEYNQSIPIYATDEIWYLENLRGVNKKVYETIKRNIDLMLSLIAAPIAFLLSIFIIIGIKTTSKGPIIYKQKRVGKGEVIFIINKFRTMEVNAEKNGAQWADTNDTRITPLGRYLRRFRLDEIPQIINVIKGEMNFVGPRPERPEFVASLSKSIPHYNLRHMIRPGLTGWAQINYPYASSKEDTAIKLEYDLYYLKNRSNLLDTKIMLKTIMIILTKKGR